MIASLFAVWAAVMIFQIAMWPRISTSRPWRLVALAGTLAVSLAHQVMFSTLAEDAFISFRYSMNLAEGNGLVFNVGERVEGYSNFLWVVLVAAPHALFGADIILVARVLGILCSLACVVLVYLLAMRISDSGGAGVLAATITAVSSSFAAYGPSGLETPLFGLLLVATLLAIQANRAAVAGLLIALATMTRPDGVVIAALIGLWLIGRAVWRRTGIAPVLRYAGVAFALLVPWTVWRLQYYGYLLPNAIAAKTGASLRWQFEVGWKYLMGFAGAAQALLILVPVAMFVLVVRRGRIETGARDLIWLLFALALAYMAFFTATGGDWMPGWRFFAPAVPLLAVALAATWGVTVRAEADPVVGRVGPLVTGGIGLVLLIVSVYGAQMKPVIDQWRQQVHELSYMGTWLRGTLPEGTVITTFANGALSYEAGPKVTVIDQLGLTDEFIARRGKRVPVGGMVGHLAHDWDYVVGVRHPDVALFTGSGYALALPCDVPAVLGDRYLAAPFQLVGQQRWIPVLVRKASAAWVLPALGRDPRYQAVPCPAPVR